MLSEYNKTIDMASLWLTNAVTKYNTMKKIAIVVEIREWKLEFI